ncbi:MAG TPA: hypothetical protein DDW96_03370, partial [Synergistaceae bacterium]|nr:hypothetical protein [Synergistaceae bacterium]HCP06872.1 hypothetical protein [Synergistaceae bacterium]
MVHCATKRVRTIFNKNVRRYAMSMRDIFQGSPFGGGGGEPRRQIRPLRFRKSVWILFGIVLLLAVVIPATATFYTDMLWFRERGLSQVFWTRLIPQWILFA